jgi:hypothetical protein
MRLDFEDGKYTYCIDNTGSACVLRYGEFWRDVTGDKFMYTVMAEIGEARSVMRGLPDSERVG